jgi:hypothetical protein
VRPMDGSYTTEARNTSIKKPAKSKQNKRHKQKRHTSHNRQLYTLELLSRESFTSSTDDPSIYVRTNYVPFFDKQRAITVHVCTTHCEKPKTFRDFGIKEKTNKQFESDDHSSGVFGGRKRKRSMSRRETPTRKRETEGMEQINKRKEVGWKRREIRKHRRSV